MSNITFSISVDSQMMGDGDSDPISADLQTRIYYQSGGPDLDLSLCGISTVDKGLLDCIREHHGPVLPYFTGSQILQMIYSLQQIFEICKLGYLFKSGIQQDSLTIPPFRN